MYMVSIWYRYHIARNRGREGPAHGRIEDSPDHGQIGLGQNATAAATGYLHGADMVAPAMTYSICRSVTLAAAGS